MAGLEWARDGADWPNRAASRFVEAGDVRWHVQVAGDGPGVLLLHGTGASTHSWRDVLPRLATQAMVVAPDLPGHAFSRPLRGDTQSLPGMARAAGALLARLGVAPRLIVGHSAGAAIAVRMCLDRHADPATVVSFNGAFLPPRALPGLAGQIFSPLARLLASAPFVPDLFAWRAGDPKVIARLLEATGSRLDPAGVAFYRRLGASPDHVAGALTMMARWDLSDFPRDLPRLRQRLVLVVGTRDGTVPPDTSRLVHRLVPGSAIVSLPGLGHLAHEERPDEAARVIREAGA